MNFNGSAGASTYHKFWLVEAPAEPPAAMELFTATARN
jgi:hypothetical protein